MNNNQVVIDYQQQQMMGQQQQYQYHQQYQQQDPYNQGFTNQQDTGDADDADPNEKIQQQNYQQMMQNAAQYQQFAPQQDQTLNQYVQDWNPDQIDNNYDIEARTYQGEYNGTGQRHGKGTCTNIDGSYYSGEWEYNLKSGYGEIQFQDKSKFEGTFVKGKRNGIGKLYLPNGDMIDAMWTNDMINGEGKLIKRHGREVKCIFYNNAKIELTSNQGEDCFDKCYLSMCLSCAFIVLFIMYAMTSSWLFIILGIVAWVLNFIEFGCCSNTREYFANNIQQSQIVKQLHNLKNSPPIVQFHIECYHYRSTTNSKGNTTRRKVVTHQATESLKYSQWTDQSAHIYSMDYVVKLPMARFETNCFFNYTPNAQRSFEWQKSQFFKKNKRDIHQILWTTETVDGHIQRQLVINDVEGAVDKSCLFNSTIYTILSLIGLGWIVRIHFVRKVKKVQYKLNKLIIA